MNGTEIARTCRLGRGATDLTDWSSLPGSRRSGAAHLSGMSISTATVVYSTSTGQAPFDPAGVGSPAFDSVYDPYCFVCSRCTDHVGEHDALFDAGLVTYDLDGTVRRTPTWDPEQARILAEAEYADYTARLHGPV